MADLKNVSCPSCQQKYRLPDSIENRKVVCRVCQFAFSVPGVVAGVASDQAASGESTGSFDGAMFDSLDVDDLLNAKSSGLAQRRPDPIPSNEDSRPAEHRQEPEPELDRADASKKSKDRKRNSPRQTEKTPKTRGEDPLDHASPAQPSALPITVLDRSKKKSKGKKKKKKKKKETEKSPAAEVEDGAGLGDASSDAGPTEQGC